MSEETTAGGVSGSDEKSVGQVAHQLAPDDVAEYLPRRFAVVRDVVNELADARPPVVARDEQVFVRKLARPLDGSGQRVGRCVVCAHKKRALRGHRNVFDVTTRLRNRQPVPAHFAQMNFKSFANLPHGSQQPMQLTHVHRASIVLGRNKVKNPST